MWWTTWLRLQTHWNTHCRPQIPMSHLWSSNSCLAVKRLRLAARPPRHELWMRTRGHHKLLTAYLPLKFHVSSVNTCFSLKRFLILNGSPISTAWSHRSKPVGIDTHTRQSNILSLWNLLTSGWKFFGGFFSPRGGSTLLSQPETSSSLWEILPTNRKQCLTNPYLAAELNKQHIMTHCLGHKTWSAILLSDTLSSSNRIQSRLLTDPDKHGNWTNPNHKYPAKLPDVVAHPEGTSDHLRGNGAKNQSKWLNSCV